jgi:hypothetical protein
MDTNKLLTAAEARKLSGATAQEEVEEALKSIEHEAKGGYRSVSLHGQFWAHEAYSGTKKYKEAKKILEDLGYKVEFFYEQKQFVDMYTVVKW